jgi:hypothetical protein
MGSEYQNRPGLSFYLPVTGMLIILFMAAGFYPYLAKQWIPSLFNRQNEKNWRWDLRYGGFRQFRFSGFLVFLQYLASMVLISLAMVSYRQLQLLDERGLGDRREEVLCIEDMPVQVVDKYLLFKSDLLAKPLIREVTIRRVLGASRSGILWRLMKIPLILTGIAITPGIFASIGFSRLWLSNFANRVDLNAWMLILPALFLLLTGLTSTLQNAWKACRIRPSVYLKDE